VKPWRLTPRAEQSLVDLFAWTIERFGERQALAYRDALIDRIKTIAAGEPPHPRPCALLMQDRPGAEGLVSYREGGHYIILRETETMVEVLELLHQNTNLPHHLQRLK